jgi:CheY-like chemotaxis protein
MAVWGISISAGMWLAPMTALAAMGCAAAFILLRDHLRLERHVRGIEEEAGRLRAELREAAGGARERAILAAQRELIAVLDPAGTLLYGNDRLARFLGLPAAALAGRRLPEPTRREPAAPLEDGGSAVAEAYTLLDGERWVHWIVTPFREGGPGATLRVGRVVPLPGARAAEPVPPAGAAMRPPARARAGRVLRVVQTRPRPVRRVLLAEDDPVNAQLALRSLERAGALVDWVQDGAEALAMVKSAFSGGRPAYDVILMDLRMPRLDGFEATRQIRRLEASLRRLKPTRIVAISATAMRQDRAAAEAVGIDAFLPKPYAPESLVSLVGPAAGSGRQVSCQVS